MEARQRLTALVSATGSRLAVVAGLLAAGGPAAAEELSVANFTNHDVIGELRISPDGSSFATTSGRYGREAIVILRRDDRKATGAVRARPGNEIRDVRWVSPTRIVFSQAERQFGRAAPARTGEIYAMNSDGTRRELLYGFRASDERTGSRLGTRDNSMASGELLSTLSDDEDSILIMEFPWKRQGRYWVSNPDAYTWISELDVYNGRRNQVDHVPLASGTALVDRDQNVRFGIGWNEEALLSVVWKPEPAAEWQAFELAGFREGSVIPRAFAADNESVLLTAVRDGESLNALFRLQLADGQVERLYQHEVADIEDVVTDLAGDDIVGVRVNADKPEYHWLDPDHPTAQLYTMLERSFAGSTVFIPSVTDDGRYAVVFVSSDVNPGDYYLLDTETKQADYLYATRQWIDPREMRPKEPIALEARDGLLLHGFLTRPRDGDGNYPLIVLPHGGPYGIRDRWDYDWEAQLFANRGYAVLQVNFRGSDGYGLDFEAAGFGEWGAKMQDDVTDATRWAIAEGIADGERICIVGTSYGGYAALMGVVREPELYRCAVGHAGVYDLDLMFETGDVPRSRTGRAFLKSVLGEDDERLRRNSPAANAAKIDVPVMLVHGKDDRRADYQQAARMREALDDAGKDYEWIALGDEGHGIYDEESREDVYRQILAFVGKQLAPRPVE